jgi:hypothetical protein
MGVRHWPCTLEKFSRFYTETKGIPFPNMGKELRRS